MTIRSRHAYGFLLAALVIAIAAGAASAWLTLRLQGAQSDTPTAQTASLNPMMDAVEAYACSKAMTRHVMFGGVEDGFARTGEEPARIHPRLLRNGYFNDLNRNVGHMLGLRAYDESGSDKTLVDHFTVPRGIVGGRLFLRMRQASEGAKNDGLTMGDMDAVAQREMTASSSQGFSLQTNLWSDADRRLLPDGSSLKVIDLSAMVSNRKSNAQSASLLAYLNDPSRGDVVDINIGDDTAVDSMALVVCQLPQQRMGVTLAEFRSKLLSQDVSFLSCTGDWSQPMCDPFVGDRLCSVPGPMACYREGGTRGPPVAVMQDTGLKTTTFVNGEVKLTAPVRGDQFPHLGDANAYCQAQFGLEWRVLSYHEGGGGTVLSYSAIAPGTRALVNIRDQQYGNCWDRDIPR